jgi:hypothetical protein
MNTNGLNLPAIRKGGTLEKKEPTKTISKLDLSKKTSVSNILKEEITSVQSEIMEQEKGLDLVLVGDLTTSMTEYHKLLKNKFKELSRDLFKMIKSLRIGVVFYLDHDNHLPYVTKVCKLMNDVENLCSFIERTPVSYEGNSTFDEAVEDALNDLLQNMNWKETNSRSVVIFGDAAPHSINRCTKNLDFFEITKKLYNQNVTVNSVYCDNYNQEKLQKLKDTRVGNFNERLSLTPNTRAAAAEFFSWIANVTGGMVLSIDKIEDLVDMIMASAAKDSGNLDELEKNMKTIAPNKLKLIDIARKAEQRKKLGGNNNIKMLT